jgi:hypothetical protein
MKITERLVQHIESKMESNRQTPITSTVDPEEIRKHLAAKYQFDHPLSIDEVFI